MQSAEVLSQLRTLNWMTQELHRLSSGNLEGRMVAWAIKDVRARLPSAILSYHDSLAAEGRASTAQLKGRCCGACQRKLSRGLLAELGVPGCFRVCPHCGVFLWKGEARREPRKFVARRNTRKVLHG